MNDHKTVLHIDGEPVIERVINTPFDRVMTKEEYGNYIIKLDRIDYSIEDINEFYSDYLADVQDIANRLQIS